MWRSSISAGSGRSINTCLSSAANTVRSFRLLHKYGCFIANGYVVSTSKTAQNLQSTQSSEGYSVSDSSTESSLLIALQRLHYSVCDCDPSTLTLLANSLENRSRHRTQHLTTSCTSAAKYATSFPLNCLSTGALYTSTHPRTYGPPYPTRSDPKYD